MKLISWNVNGIRAAWKKGLREFVAAEQPDVLCIQETKASENQLPTDLKEVPGYCTYYSSGGKKGYGGVGLLSRERPLRVSNSLGIDGFDDEGSQFDAEGNLRDWWTAEDKKKFEERTNCVKDEYGSFVAVDDLKLNGKLTLGENTADNGGMRIAYMALMSDLAGKEPPPVDGLTAQQRFFLGWANVWCQNRTDAFARMLVTIDPHSPGKNRVNGTVSNMPEFRDAYHCKADAPMVSQNASTL